MISERDRTQLEGMSTMDLRFVLKSLYADLASTYNPSRRQWIISRAGFVESLIAERNIVS